MVASTVIGGAIEGFSDRSLCSLGQEIKDRTISHLRLPKNHDLERGIRTVQLQASMHVLRAWRKTLPRPEEGTLERKNERIFAEPAQSFFDRSFRKSLNLKFDEGDIDQIEELATLVLSGPTDGEPTQPA